eukprot:COSAG02_NODE_11713_length_1669_cov_2.010828_2_plen_84_part_00
MSENWFMSGGFEWASQLRHFKKETTLGKFSLMHGRVTDHAGYDARAVTISAMLSVAALLVALRSSQPSPHDLLYSNTKIITNI